MVEEYKMSSYKNDRTLPRGPQSAYWTNHNTRYLFGHTLHGHEHRNQTDAEQPSVSRLEIFANFLHTT